ncbi:lipocalin family protein [Thalassococcus lentus]|uniref:Lipocalin family protein n=1 Tax=Thalassococcus lentus TaxID=1210524 RepID=A0ABT4XQH8_9RHOB|nr:lipocalin family protein [Thalassococcus lentus]MDA7424207.1 lipocalin family protein [Thalassococcus lentus]
MRIFVAALGLLLCGCMANEPQPLGPATIPLRNPTAPVASQLDASLARLAGTWVVVQGAGLNAGSNLRFDGQSVSVNGAQLALQDKGRGRIVMGNEEIWVHWIDADNRTAALGEPNGGRVWIMDRTGQPGERLKAAREILDWYGYDLRRLAENG